MIIRKATMADLDIVTDIEAKCFLPTEAAGKESFHYRLEAFHNHFLLLEDEGEYIGMVNVMAFPGIFRGAFDVRASDINDAMKLAAAKAIADIISDEELSEDYVMPNALDPRIGKAVAKAVAQAARDTGVARI